MEKKIIFIHIPKTGGTSIYRSLKDKVDIGYHYHEPLHRIYSKEQLNDSFVFTVVRNPWDKLVSTFFYCCQTQKHQWFFKKYDSEFDMFMKDFKRGKVPYLVLFKAQYKFLMHKPDMILKFECLQQDFNKLCDKIGIEKYELPHNKKSKHKHFTEYYNDETKKIVSDIYQKDVELLNYKFKEK